MHPLWMLFRFIQTIKELVLFTIAFIVFIGSDWESILVKIGVAAALFYVIYKIVSVVLDWRHFKYTFTDHEMCIYEGRFIRKRRYIPLDRIQGINKNTSLFHRIFGLTSLLLNTGADGKEAYVKLEMITFDEAERIQNDFRHIGSHPDDNAAKEEPEPTPTAPVQRYDYEVTVREIIVASLTSNRFLVFIALLQTIYFNMNDFFAMEHYLDATLSFFQRSWIVTLLGVLGFLLLSMAYTLVRNYVQFRNFKVHSDHHRIYIEKGLINRSEFSIPKEKVQAVNVKTSFLQKWFRIVEVKIVSSGHEDEEDINVSNVLFPFINRDRAMDLIPDILPAFKIESDMQRLSFHAIMVKIFRSLIFGALAVFIALTFFPDYGYVGYLLLIFAVVSQWLNGIHSSYGLNGSFMQLQKGAFSTRLFVTKQYKIEEFEVTESMLQRFFGLASIIVYTRADPIRVTKMADISKEMAIRYYHWYANEHL